MFSLNRLDEKHNYMHVLLPVRPLQLLEQHSWFLVQLDPAGRHKVHLGSSWQSEFAQSVATPP